MDKRTCFFLSALVLFASMSGVTAYAHEQECNGWGTGEKHGFASNEYGLEKRFIHKAFFLIKAQDKLGLYEDQVKAISNLKLETEKNAIHQEADLKTLDLDIRTQLHSDKSDLDSLSKLIDQKYEAKKIMEKVAAEAYLKLKGILTPDQQAALKKLKKEWKEKRFDEHGEEGFHHRHHGFSGVEEKPAGDTEEGK